MAERRTPENVPHEFEAIQEQVAQLRSDVVALGQTLLEWGQRETGAARNELTGKAKNLGEALSDTIEGAQKRGNRLVETAQKRGNKLAEAAGRPQKESSSATSLPAITAGMGMLFLALSGVSWAAKRLAR